MPPGHNRRASRSRDSHVPGLDAHGGIGGIDGPGVEPGEQGAADPVQCRDPRLLLRHPLVPELLGELLLGAFLLRLVGAFPDVRGAERQHQRHHTGGDDDPGEPMSVPSGTRPKSPSAPAMLAATLASTNPVASFHCRPGMVRTIRAVVRPTVHRS